MHPSRVRVRTPEQRRTDDLQQLRPFSLVPLAINYITPTPIARLYALKQCNLRIKAVHGARKSSS